MNSGRTYAGRSATERSADRRAAFLEAGLELYGTRPLDGVSIADLVAESGQTRRAFYELFDDREALLRQVDEQVRSGAVATVTATAGPPPYTWADAERTFEALLRFYQEDPRRINVAFVAVVGVSPEMEAHRRRSFRIFGDAFGELLGDRAGLDPPARRRAVQAMAGAFSELLTDWAWARDEPFEAVAEELLRLVKARFFPESSSVVSQ